MFIPFAGCDKFDPLCGDSAVYDLQLLSPALAINPNSDFYTYLEDGNRVRVYQWSKFIENVCPTVHVKVQAVVNLQNANFTSIKARGRVDWQFLFEREFEMPQMGGIMQGNTEVGLKQAFGEDPASFSPVLEIFFETTGDEFSDREVLIHSVNSIQLIANYKKYN